MTQYRANLSQQFSGQYFIVTGATQGLGRAVALLLAKRGAKGVLIAGRNSERGEQVVAELIALGCQGVFFSLQLQSVEACKALVERADQLFGTLNGVVNCAGFTGRGGLLDTDEALFDQMFAVNAKAPFFIMQSAAKLMIRDSVEGSMVNISSVSAHGGQSFLTPYSASKTALNTLTKNAAFSLLRNRIRINALNIGWMDSDGEHQVQKAYHDAPDDWLEAVEAREPFGRLVKPEEVARAAAYLLSEESGLLSGSVIDFDQGVIGCGDARTPQPEQPLSFS
ncbi:MAG: SDR family oxidoreductase [Pseudomonadales bacterium]